MHPVVFARERPANGVPEEIAPGLFWLRLPLPFALDHVNVWLIDDADGWTLVDTGYGDAACRAIWEQALAGLLAGRPVRRLLVTHFHPDHSGLAGWLAERTGAELLMARTEWLTARWLALDDTDGMLDAADLYYRQADLDAGLRTRLRARRNAYRRGVTPVPATFRRIRGGDTLGLAGSDWTVVVGRGHAPEQVTFWSRERGLLIAADQLLPRITPVIGAWFSEPDADPLGEFDESLGGYAALPDDILVLPSHDRPYYGLHDRIAGLLAHHRLRLDQTLALCAGPSTTAAVMLGLFPRALDLHQTGFALAETRAHLNRLLVDGRVERETDGQGVDRWRRR